jgi:hypothetical protein
LSKKRKLVTVGLVVCFVLAFPVRV